MAAKNITLTFDIQPNDLIKADVKTSNGIVSFFGFIKFTHNFKNNRFCMYAAIHQGRCTRLIKSADMRSLLAVKIIAKEAGQGK